MPDLIIKPNSATGNKLILQDQAGNAVLTTDDSAGAALGGNLAVSGLSTLTGNLAVSGLSTLTGNTIVSGNLAVSGLSTLTGNTIVSGTLTVEGTTTTIESVTLTVDDKNIELGSVDSPTDTTADGGGITLKGATDKTILWENDTDSWNFNQNIETSTTTKVKQKGAFMQNSVHQSWVMGG
jgi:hypothetical protein